jgi:hypothetical protein
MKKITNNYEALVIGLRLAISAKTESQTKKCLKIIDQIAARLPDHEIEKAKKEALQDHL